MKMRNLPPILSEIIHTAFLACNDVRFDAGITCRYCGGPLSGYDERRKRFAVLLEDDQPSPVYVILQRSRCRSCGRVVSPEEPFYPGTRVGSPVVDLCRSLSLIMPCTRASTYLAQMGVQVDRWSVRHYARAPLSVIPAMDVFGMKMPVSVITLSTLAGSRKEPGPLAMDDVLEACNHPSLFHGSPDRPAGGHPHDHS